jgi:hypothetical protein
MNRNDEVNENEMLAALADYQRTFKRVDELAAQYQARAEAARQFLKEKARIEEQLTEGSYRSLMQAELGIESLAERVLQSK